MTTAVPLSVNVSPELKAAVQALADAGNRPLSNEVRKALEDHVSKGYVKSA